MPGKVAISFVDTNDESTTVNMWVPTYTAAAFDAQQTLVDTLVAAVNAVSLLFEWKDQRSVNVVKATKVPPADNEAHREKKWLVRAGDDVTGKAVNFEIGGADLTLLLPLSDNMDISAGAGAALVTAIEAVVTSDVGNAITVIDILFVGRNT